MPVEDQLHTDQTSTSETQNSHSGTCEMKWGKRPEQEVEKRRRRYRNRYSPIMEDNIRYKEYISYVGSFNLNIVQSISTSVTL